MALLVRYAADDWRQASQVVVILIAQSPSSACTSLPVFPGRKRVVPYSIQTLKRLKPTFFRQDLTVLFELLQEHKIKPIVAHRFPLYQARQAQESLGKGGVIGKIVLVPTESSLASAAVLSRL
jgi:NADPH:quinone reductase-like Zn-dependent oxidoreductase